MGWPLTPGPESTAMTARPPILDAPPRLVVRLLGEVSVTLDGRPVPDLAAPRVQRLLARVALAPGAAVRRDRLAGSLWPDSTEAQARTNLRKLLHDVRHVLDAFLDARSQEVRWRTGPDVEIDVVAFTAALARDDPRAAVGHYGGDLLPGCADDWVLAERERLRRLAVDALAGLAAAAAQAGDDEASVRHARALLRHDAVHEPAHRLLMAALARRGERTEALRTYERFAAALADELGVAPEPATRLLHEQLRRAAPRAPRASSALVGRGAQWRTAWAAWRAAAAGRSGLLLVTGEAGIGKSRLVEELARRAAADGATVAAARAYEAAGRPPWGPVVDWLRADAVRPFLDRLGDPWRHEVARLVPELSAGAGPADAADADGTRRHRLLDALRRGLLAPPEPLLLVLDDVQWCDRDTLGLCAFLLAAAPAAPLLIAATARTDEIDGEHPAERLRRDAERAGRLALLPLGPLDRAATVAMAAGLGCGELDAAAAGRLFTETEGNPLFVAEAVRAGFGGARAARPPLTPTVQALMGARLERLSPAARAVVDVAATIGREFDAGVLATAAQLAEDELAEVLDELWERHVVRERGAAYDFSHDRLREVALGLISPARRRKLHRAVAAALERHHADDPAPVSARIAAHYERAGLAARAVAAYERAAVHAYRVFALDDAIALLERGLGLLDGTPPGAGRDAVELRLRAALGVPLVARRGYGAAAVQHSYERALTLHRRLGRPPGADVLRGLALHAVVTCRFDRAAEMGHRLVAAGDTDRTARVEGDYVLGVTAFWLGGFAAAGERLRAALDGYRVEDSPLHIARYAQDPRAVCLSRLALNDLVVGRPAEAARRMDAALAFAAELDHPMTTGYVRAWDAILAALTPDARDLGAALGALETVTTAMHIGYFELLARVLRGWHDVLSGRPGGLERIARTTDHLRREQPLHMTLGLALLARGHLRAGDTAAGRAAVGDALRFTARTGQRYLLAELLTVDAELRALDGDRAGAEAGARRALATAEAQGAGWLCARARAALDRLG